MNKIILSINRNRMRAHNKRLLYILLLLCIVLFILWYLAVYRQYEGFRNNVQTKGLILTLHGGLGNQLFVYAAAIKLKRKFNVPIYLLIDGSTKTHSERDYRFLMDGVTAIDTNNSIVTDARNFNFSNTYAYDDYNEDEIPTDDTAHINIGIHCFQRYEKIKYAIQEVKDSILPKFKELYDDLTIQSYTSAFIHVRRGDYLTDGGGGRMISPDFYKEGLKILNKIEAVETIYIFSDDITWCKEQPWESPKEIEYYDDPDELKTLYMMSQCWAGAVISNSTFSLWGVFLGAYNRTNMIVYPTNEFFVKDLPTNWIKI